MADDHPSEAACLLEQGASYRRRIGLKPLHQAGRSDLRRLQAGRLLALFRRRADLSLRSRGPLAAGVRRRHALSEGARRDGPRDRPGARRAQSRLEAKHLRGCRDHRLRHAGALDGPGIAGRCRGGEAGPSRTHLAQGQALAPDELRDFLERISRGTPPPGPPIASGTSRPTARCRSCRPNARTRSSCKRRWVTRAGFASGRAVPPPCPARSRGRIRAARQRGGRALGPAASAEPRSCSWPGATCCTSRSTT